MLTYRLFSVGCAVAVVVLLIGVTAAYFKIPLAVEIITAALGAIALLIRAITQKVNREAHHPESSGRAGGYGAR